MPRSEALKRAQDKYALKNKERIASYKARYWLANKHKWPRRKAGSQEPESQETGDHE